ncbi:hypothetical protein [Nocardiopsis sp. ATB16-24]|uniref:hypothetical protein n=1 Tax=Nocardiopsis sp. ATB16-24 TaxID=3019555 RepID=UPI0025572BB5|nr:hypothetical protein [Nocardiopsis sp. ATB16-24]
MQGAAGKKDTTEVYVYVGKAGAVNLDRGIEKSVWGWKTETAEEREHHEVLTSLKKGDLLHLGHLGLGRIPGPEAQSRTVARLVTTRLTGGLYEDGSHVWDDEVYPYRVPLTVEGTRYDVTKDDIGPEAIEALRKSASGKGGPKLPENRESVLEQLLNEAIEAHKGTTLLDPEDPADQRNLDLPPVLDRPAYVYARAEQKRLRAEKLEGRTEVPCDLCQMVLPTRLVHTAHIKRRSASSPQERGDLGNVMNACVLGCDSLFEHGFVYVDVDGYIHASEQVRTDALTTAVERLGGSCSAFSQKNAHYFAWHRENIANVKKR